MKHSTLLLTGLALALITAGCGKETTTAQELDNLQAETRAATQAVKEQDYTFTQKSEFTAKLQRQLAEINRELDQLAARIAGSSAAIQAEAQPKLQALRDQAAKLNTQLDAAKNATESTWDSVKAGTKQAYGELQEGFVQARQWVSEKIAP